MAFKHLKIYILVLLFIIIIPVLIIIFANNSNNSYTNKKIIQNQWALFNDGQSIKDIEGKKKIDINAINSWNVTLGNKNVVVGVLDTGIQIKNPKIVDSIFINQKEVPNNHKDDDQNGYVDDINGWDFYNNENSIYDNDLSDYHGTFITSLITATHNKNEIWGIAPNITILPLKFMQGNNGNVDDASKAIDYAHQMGVQIINCSWDNTKYDDNLYYTMKKYKDILFICSSGKGNNDLQKNPVYPACFNLNNVICVGAVDNTGKLFDLSGYGFNGEVFAPGKDILGMLPDGDITYSDGTSLATAYVTGIAALVKSYKTNISVIDLAQVLKSSQKEIKNSFKTPTGYIIDARLCLDKASNIK